MSEEPKMKVFKVPCRLFELGNVVATPGALEATTDTQRIEMLGRHLRGDWGVIDPVDRKTNFDALFNGDRLFSAYPIDDTKPCAGCGLNTIWIITEADRSVTTFLLPSEY